MAWSTDCQLQNLFESVQLQYSLPATDKGMMRPLDKTEYDDGYDDRLYPADTQVKGAYGFRFLTEGRYYAYELNMRVTQRAQLRDGGVVISAHQLPDSGDLSVLVLKLTTLTELGDLIDRAANRGRRLGYLVAVPESADDLSITAHRSAPLAYV